MYDRMIAIGLLDECAVRHRVEITKRKGVGGKE